MEATLVVVLAGMIFVMNILLIVILWRTLGAVQSLAHLQCQNQERERHDEHHLIEMLTEKIRTGDELRTTTIHARERVHQRQLDNRVEMAETVGRTPNVMPQVDLRNLGYSGTERPCTPAEATNQ